MVIDKCDQIPHQGILTGYVPAGGCCSLVAADDNSDYDDDDR